MIFGIGTDICETGRIKEIIQKKYAHRFISRVLTDKELNVFQSLSENRQVEYLAGRFAIKEAISKALGTGIGEQFGFHDVSIINEPTGKPRCEFDFACLARFPINTDYFSCHVSISHEKAYVVAFVVIEH